MEIAVSLSVVRGSGGTGGGAHPEGNLLLADGSSFFLLADGLSVLILASGANG